MSFETWESEALAPAFFQDDPILDFIKIYGREKDFVIDGAKQGVVLGLKDYADSQSLPLIGQNFATEKPFPFTELQYREKLKQSWNRWITSGTPNRLITEIKELGFTKVYIVPQYVESPPGKFKLYIPGLDDHNSQIAALGNFWSNFWVVIDQPHNFTRFLWGSPPPLGEWGSGYLWGAVNGDINILRQLVRIIKQMKPAWTSCRGIIFIQPGVKIWGVPNWNDGTLWGLNPQDYAVLRISEDWEL